MPGVRLALTHADGATLGRVFLAVAGAEEVTSSLERASGTGHGPALTRPAHLRHAEGGVRDERMKRVIIAGAALALGLTAVLAQEQDPIKRRQATFKSWAAASREPGLMLRGQAPFNLEKVQAALRTFVQDNKHLPNLFPQPNAPGGIDTGALPAIYEQREKFNAIFAKLDADATAALASIKDEATFKAEFPKVLANCGACHQSYRAKP